MAPALQTQGVEIVRCERCGLRFWQPPPDFRVRSIYGGSYFDGQGDVGYDSYPALEEALRANFARRLKRLGPPGDGSRLLDVGAAYGFGVDEAVRAGWQAEGVELSAAAVRAGPAVRGRVVVGDALQLPFPAESFDAVTLWDVLEHLTQPQLGCREAARVLRPGGRLALTTGDVGSLVARVSGARWHLYNLPEHLYFFTRESLRRLLEASGFRIDGMRAEGAVYPLGYLVERLRKTLLRARGGRRRFPGDALRVSVNLFDVVTVVARKVSRG